MAKSRRHLVGQALLRLDPALAARAALDPDSVSEAEELKLRIFGDATDPWARELIDTITDPFLLLGLALSAKYPVAAAGKMFKYASKFEALNQLHIPGVERLRSFLPKFRGTVLEWLYPEAIAVRHAAKARWSGEAGAVLKAFESGLGRRLTAEEDILLYADDVNSWLALNKVRGRLAMPDHLKPLKRDLQKVLGKSYSETTEGRHIREVAARLRDSHIDVDIDAHLTRDYLPRQRVRGIGDMMDEYERVAAAATGDTQAAHAATRARVSRRVGSELRARHNVDAPCVSDLELVAGHFDDPGTIARVADIVRTRGIGQYNLRLVEKVLPRYFDSMSRTYSLTTKGYGARIVAEVEGLKRVARGEAEGYAPHQMVNAKLLATQMDNTYMPLLLRDTTPARAKWALEWASAKHSAAARIGDMLGSLGEGNPLRPMLAKTRDALISEEGMLSHAGSKLTGWLTAGALGANLPAALQNLSSTVLLGAQIGPRSAARGVKEVASKYGRYWTLRKAKGEWEAWRTVFPEFAESGLVADPLAGEVREMVNGAYRAGHGVGAKLADFQRALVSPFSFGETTQRLTAFYGALHKGRVDKLAGEELGRFARRMVYESQFTAGPVATPELYLNLPPMLRHFLSYGTRFVEQLGASTAWGTAELQGGMLHKLAGGRNWGTVGRLMLATSVVEGAGRMVGQDWSRYGFTGSLPRVDQGGPFAPFPLVPPVMDILGSAAMDLSSGELNELKKSLPLMIPGGAAMSRMVGLASPRVAQALNREWTDWTPDAGGKYTLFDGRGRSRGQYSAFQLMLRAGGFPVGDMDAEAQARRQVLALRDRIGETRKEYLRLSIAGDEARAQDVAAGYRAAFGVDLDVRPQDWDVARMHQRVARNHALIGTMPKALRPQLLRIAQLDMANSASAAQGRGVDPRLLNPRWFWSEPERPTRFVPLGGQAQAGGGGMGGAPGGYDLPAFSLP